jgi:hypothetical protein
MAFIETPFDALTDPSLYKSGLNTKPKPRFLQGMVNSGITCMAKLYFVKIMYSE